MTASGGTAVARTTYIAPSVNGDGRLFVGRYIVGATALRTLGIWCRATTADNLGCRRSNTFRRRPSGDSCPNSAPAAVSLTTITRAVAVRSHGLDGAARDEADADGREIVGQRRGLKKTSLLRPSGSVTVVFELTPLRIGSLTRLADERREPRARARAVDRRSVSTRARS